jgi:sucrose phosphorylase
MLEKIREKLAALYGQEQAGKILVRVQSLIEKYRRKAEDPRKEDLSERDVMLITYADSFYQPGRRPLTSLQQICEHRFKDLFSLIHILPFFPYSSDDGFSVIDYRQVNPHHGNWEDIARLARDFALCFDLVLNHTSASSDYFKGYLNGDARYQDFFIELDENTDTSSVLRPRTSPLLHCYETSCGLRWCWTTFSRDQLDLNYKNPDVLLEMLDILLFYVQQGARMVRLDAIAYLWKELGTRCAHLPQTHMVVQLMREVLNVTSPEVLLLSETNVPHKENISYFGDGYNEAQVVYNFPLPPLVLHTLTVGSAKYLADWARTIEPVSPQTTFLNFTASHDGIGVRPAADILTDQEFQALLDLAVRHDGQVSYKNDTDGNAIPYELNINYFDALNNPNDPDAEPETEINRFLLSQSIALTLQGTPAIYIHSLLGSRNWAEGVRQSGQARSINREKLDLDLLEQQLLDEFTRRAQVFNRYSAMIRLRRQEKAFHPQAGQVILDAPEELFALARTSQDQKETIIAVHNVTGHRQVWKLDSGFFSEGFSRELTNLLDGTKYISDSHNQYTIELQPYQIMWLKIG